MQEDYNDPLTYREPEEKTGVKTFAIPDRALNVEAATLSALAEDDTTALQQYQSMTMTPREDQAQVMQSETQRVRAKYDEFVRQGLAGFVMDTQIPGDVRQTALATAPSAKYAPEDPSIILGVAAGSAPQEDTSPVGEDVRSIIVEGLIRSNKYLDGKTSIVNQAVGRHDGVYDQVLDTMSLLLVPGQDAVTGAKLASEMGTSITKGVFLPGTQIQEYNKKFLSLPPDEKMLFIKQVADSVSKASGMIGGPNVMRAEVKLQAILDEGGYSDWDEAWDNLMNIVDLVGLGVGAKAVTKGATQAARNMAARRQAANNTFSRFERSGGDVPMDTPELPTLTGESEVTSAPRTMANTDELARVEAELAEAKRSVGSQLSRDEFEETQSSLQLLKSNKERLSAKATPKEVAAFAERQKQRQERIDELQTKLDSHTNAITSEERVATLEDRLNTLKQTNYEVDMPKSQLQQALDRAYTNSIIAPTHPRAPANILSQTNFDKGRAAYVQAVMDESGQFAQAMYGTSREEAIVSQILPQAGDSTGRVVRKMDDPEKGYRKIMAANLEHVVNNVRDGLRYTEAELALGRANVVKDYSSATGLKINDAMTTVEYNGDRIYFSGTYTNGEGGWSSAAEASEQAKFALRRRGIDDGDVEVLKLEGDEFVPTSKTDTSEGVYAVRIKTYDQVRDNDIVDKEGNPAWDNLNVKRNFFDRFSGKGKNSIGSFVQHITEPNSLFKKNLTGSFSVGEDKSSLITDALLKRFESFGQGYRSLDKQMRAAVEDYIIRANVQQIPFDENALRTQFPEKVVDMLRSWRDAWDDMYLLENADTIKSLRFEGYELFKHPNIEAVVKKATQGYKGERIYDPASDTSRVLTEDELKTIRDQGGYIGRFRSPMDLNGYSTEFMIVRNNTTEYARAFNDTDRILNYRHGYYQVRYKAPKFIEAHTVDNAGKKVPKVVGVAGSTKEAKELIERMKKADPDTEFTFRGDERDISRDRDVYWELNNSFGRVAQRHRGKLVEETVGMQCGNLADLVENPAESAIRAAMSLGGRVALRDALTTAKTRWMHQFGHLLADKFPKEFPASRDDIFKKGGYTTKELADARSTWNYINTMENGYINHMDVGLKLAFNALADTAGLKGWDTVEKLSQLAGDVNVTGKVKGAAFLAYLATNPLRMWFVQGGQALRIAGFSHVHTPKVLQIATDYAHAQKNQEFINFYKSTGLDESLNRSNLVRGTLLESAARKGVTGRAVDSAAQTVRRIGFDAGETFNNVITAAAVFEKYKRLGKDVDDLNTMAQMHAELRALTRNMNRAGDMPYNHNYLALAFTYMQVPHKFALQWADRTLTPLERTRLIAADLSLWGMPVGLGAYVAGHELLEGKPVLQEIAEDGLASMFLNWTFRSQIDFSSMAPWDLTGFHDIFKNVMGDKGLAALITESPSGRILGLSSDSRLGMALQTSARMFTTFNDDDLTRTTVVDAADAWLRISSGWNNLQESVIMYQLGKVTDRQGRTSDDEVTYPEIVAKALGFGTKDTRKYYDTVMEANATVKSAQENARKAAQDTLRMIRHATNGDMAGVKAAALYSQAYFQPSNFPDTATHGAALSAGMAEFFDSADQKVTEAIMKGFGVPSTLEEMTNLGRASALPQEDKERLISVFKEAGEFYKELQENNKD